MTIEGPVEPPPHPPRQPVFANGPTGTPSGEALFGTRAQWRRDLAIAAAIGLFMGAVGPFGTYLNTSRLTVIAYWIGAILTGQIMFGLTVRPATILAPRLRMPPLLAALVVTAIMAAPLSLLCHTVAMALWPTLRGHVSLALFYGQTLVVAGTLSAFHTWFATRRAPVPAADPPPIAGDFLSRIPGHLGRELIALQMEDHYVRVHTSAGSALILIPLRQALAELGAVPGLQVHRSWWVARHAVVGTVADGRNLRLRLVNGLQAPVSRARVAEARAAQLFMG